MAQNQFKKYKVSPGRKISNLDKFIPGQSIFYIVTKGFWSSFKKYCHKSVKMWGTVKR